LEVTLWFNHRIFSRAEVMHPMSTSIIARRNLIGQAMRLIRRARRMRTRDVGLGMGIGQRTYEYVEAGKISANLERLSAFAKVTECDLNAIVISELITSPEFARRSADNKLATALIITMQEFDQELGDDISLLDAASCLSVFGAAFRELTHEARRRGDARDRLQRQGAALAGESAPNSEAPPSPQSMDSSDGS
jgi:transcriptional regulator with XRE-family HTH domain